LGGQCSAWRAAPKVASQQQHHTPAPPTAGRRHYRSISWYTQHLATYTGAGSRGDPLEGGSWGGNAARGALLSEGGLAATGNTQSHWLEGLQGPVLGYQRARAQEEEGAGGGAGQKTKQKPGCHRARSTRCSRSR
jgi:hypothetical protein